MSMLCPICSTKLSPGKPHRYKTLCEHVDNPNGESPLRGTLVCPNEECKANTTEIYWSKDGEGYYGGTTFERFPFIDNCSHALGSLSREIYLKVYGQ